MDTSSPTPPIPPSPDGTDALNLKQVARLLDVHYMTVYRYVRHGRLPARREGANWMVDRADAEALRDGRVASSPGEAVDWCARLVPTLAAGDEVAGWTVLRDALNGGHDFVGVHLTLIAGALAEVGARVSSGDLSAAQERVAVSVAFRLVARLGGQFPHRGRKRGTVVLCGPVGEYHGFPLALVANLIRHAGFSVLELGVDTSAAELDQAVGLAEDLVAVGIGVTTTDRLDAAIELIRSVKASRPGLAVLLGGQAVRNPEIAHLAGASMWSAGPDMIETLNRLRRPRPTVVVPADGEPAVT